MSERYYLRGNDHSGYEVIDRCSTNGYGEPWVELPALPLPLARANCWRLNATWREDLPPCTCNEGDTDE
jgi:hypothetical protein